MCVNPGYELAEHSAPLGWRRGGQLRWQRLKRREYRLIINRLRLGSLGMLKRTPTSIILISADALGEKVLLELTQLVDV